MKQNKINYEVYIEKYKYPWWTRPKIWIVFCITFFLCAWLVFFVLASIYDLNISNEVRTWSEISGIKTFAIVLSGIVSPLYMLFYGFLIVGTIENLIAMPQFTWRHRVTMAWIIYIFLSIIYIFIAAQDFNFNKNIITPENMTNLICTFIALILFITFFVLVRNKAILRQLLYKYGDGFYLAFIYGLLLSFTCLIFKSFFGRIRPDERLSEDDFWPWYIPNFTSSRGDSFPSGHTANIANLFGLVIILNSPHKKNKTAIVCVSSLLSLITIGVMWSRITLGRHYLSDTLFSVLLGFMYGVFVIPAISLSYDKYKVRIYLRSQGVNDVRH